MRIGIDGNEANVHDRVGVNTYAFEILHGLYRIHKQNPGKHSFKIYLKSDPNKELPKAMEGWEYKVIAGRGFWIIRKLMPTLIKEAGSLDVFFTPSHYLPLFSRIPMVCAIMDLGYLEFSGQFNRKDFWQLRLWSAWSIYISKRIISISEATKKDIVRHYKFASSKIKTTLLGYKKHIYDTSTSENDVRRIKKKFGIKKDYILFLSTLKPSKNIEGLLKAWSEIEQNFPDAVLVIAGRKGWLYETIFEKVKKLKIRDRVVFTGFVDEEDKPDLIKSAKLFVLPSFWEGFGLDVLSSLASGVPVVVSDRGSLPEVAGGAGLIVDPDNISELADAISKVLSMGKLDYNKLADKGREQAKKFSWDKAAAQTLEILENAKR